MCPITAVVPPIPVLEPIVAFFVADLDLAQPAYDDICVANLQRTQISYGGFLLAAERKYANRSDIIRMISKSDKIAFSSRSLLLPHEVEEFGGCLFHTQ